MTSWFVRGVAVLIGASFLYIYFTGPRESWMLIGGGMFLGLAILSPRGNEWPFVMLASTVLLWTNSGLAAFTGNIDVIVGRRSYRVYEDRDPQLFWSIFWLYLAVGLVFLGWSIFLLQRKRGNSPASASSRDQTQ
jgi:hypothetical protein